MSKKKLVQINTVCNGSTGRIMNQIQQTAENEGWEAYSFFGRGKPANEKCYKITNMVDVLYSVFLTRVFGLHGYGCKRATKKLIKNIEKINPDVIQLHNIHGYYINIKILFDYLKNCNKKIVWTLHDCWAFTGHCSHFDYVECDKWKTQCEKCIQKNQYPKSIIKDKSYTNYLLKKETFNDVKNMILITPSEWLAKNVKESFLQKYKVKVINNGIDLKIFKPTESNFRKENELEDKFVILGIANIWNERKGLNVFINLSKKLDERYKIVLVGLKHKQIKKLPKNIIGIQQIDDIKKLVEIYTMADLFINPSTEETMGLTTVEAMACGTYVLVNNKTAIPEVINKYSGDIVNNNNIEQYIEKIYKLKDKLYKSEECSKQAQKYDHLKKYNEYLKIYMES